MKLTSRAGDYALLLLIHLAGLPDGESTNIKKVAEKLNLSGRFLANISNKLVTHRLVTAQRGTKGGIRLAKPATAISVKEVIEATDGPIQTMFCQNTHLSCNFEELCRMKYLWDGIQNLVIGKLTETTIADLAKHPASIPESMFV